MSRIPAFSFVDVSKSYVSREGSIVGALELISLEGRAGDVTCIVGPTGSGKSTILRLASGLEYADSGEVRIAGASPLELRGRIGYLTQRHTLLPWMSVEDNIGLPLKVRGVDAAGRKEHAGRICGLLGLSGSERMYPYELSGGMQQRAAIGRLLASGASYWLMDEPFSALDEKTLHRLQSLLLRIVRDNGLSVLFVTHSLDEAVFLADRVVVLSAGPGRVIESFGIGLPHPRNRLSAEYGEVIERTRRIIESVLKEEVPQAPLIF